MKIQEMFVKHIMAMQVSREWEINEIPRYCRHRDKVRMHSLDPPGW